MLMLACRSEPDRLTDNSLSEFQKHHQKPSEICMLCTAAWHLMSDKTVSNVLQIDLYEATDSFLNVIWGRGLLCGPKDVLK